MESFCTSMNSFCIFARFMGFFPFAINGKSLKFTITSVAITIASICVFLIEAICNLFHNYVFIEKDARFFDSHIWNWFLRFVHPITFLQICIHMYKTKEIKEFYQHMQIVDLKFNHFYLQIDHSSQKKFVKFVMNFTLLLLFVRFCSSVIIIEFLSSFEWNAIIQEIFYARYLLYETFFCLQFIIPTYLLRKRFEILKELLDYQNFKSYRFFNINKFDEVFHDLCDAIKMINSLFTFHLIPVIFEMMIVNIFGLYADFYLARIKGNWQQILMTSLYIIAHFILKCLVAHIGNSTTNAVEEIIASIAKLISKLPSNDVSRFTFYNLLRQFQTRNFKFQSFFLTVNWNFLLAVSFYQ
ncbi:hypothetical protein PVAND_013404 [Polypedilum vanderplanki]|uniref:Gustatory receptor n=1 Tax=Polypedilum vanderplanki TaxID=319348 RepID=A0A9J6CRG1_POLVA|nr:hypothetical protein PVAND_013404 [Polypedilum vanderplanki]